MHLGSRISEEDNRINVNLISSWYISCSDIYFIELSIEIFHPRKFCLQTTKSSFNFVFLILYCDYNL